MLGLISMLVACSASGTMDETVAINSIPSDAIKIYAFDVDVSNGTSYTHGSISISGAGYLVIEIDELSGTCKELKIRSTDSKQEIFYLEQGKDGIYQSDNFDFSGDYELYFGNVADFEAHFTLYLVSES